MTEIRRDRHLSNAYIGYASALKIILKHCRYDYYHDYRYITSFWILGFPNFFRFFFLFFNLDDELLTDSMERFVILLSRWHTHTHTHTHTSYMANGPFDVLIKFLRQRRNLFCALYMSPESVTRETIENSSFSQKKTWDKSENSLRLRRFALLILHKLKDL